MKARLFDKQSSGFDEVNIEFKEDRLYLYVADKTYTYLVDELEFSQRLGNMPRSIYLSDAKVCECDDNAFIDIQLKRLNLHKPSLLLHHIESKSLYIFPAVLLIIISVFVFLKYVMPYSAEKIAYSIPQDIASKIGSGTLKTLDKLVLKPTHLSQDKQDSIQQDFKAMTTNLPNLPPLNLEFRFSSKIGPNAFALPNGTIVMTDQLVLLSHNNEELLSILAHEVGHVKNRHSMRMVLQNSAVFIVIATLTGDATNASSIMSTLPTVLIESSFSRGLEEEADDYAMQLMKDSNINLHFFADIMSRLSQGQEESKTGEYFSSHPITSSRIAKFQE